MIRYRSLPELRKHALHLAAAGVVLAGLTACGGSSSDSKKDPSNPNINTPTTVSGTAAKGLLLGATVKACATTDCSASNDPIAIGKTSTTDGSYSLTVPTNYTGTVIVSITHAPGAQMICDVPAGCGDVAFGDQVAMQTDLKLRSVAVVEPSATTITAHITPITELVTVAAIQSRGVNSTTLNPDSIAKGSSAVRSLLGLGEGEHLTRIQPVDITQSEAASESDESLRLSLLAAAFAQTSENESIQQKIETMASAITTGVIDKDKLDALSNSASLALTAAPALSNRKDAIAQQLSEANNNATSQCPGNSCSVEVDLAELDSAEKAAVSQNMRAVKTLVEDVRTLGWEIYPQLERALDSDSGDYVEDNLIAQIENAAKLFDEDLERLSIGLADIATLMVKAIAQHNKLDEATFNGSLNLQAMAAAEYKYQNQDEWRFQTPCPSNFNPAGCYGSITEAQLNSEAEAYAANFNDVELVKTGDRWTLTNATFTHDHDDRNKTTVTLTAIFADITSSVKVLDAQLTGTATHGDSTLHIEEGQLRLEAIESLSIKLNEDDLWEYNGSGFNIDNAVLKVKANLENNKGNVTRKFNGRLELQARTTAQQKQKNLDNVNAILPTMLVLEGGFTATNTQAGMLNAKLSATFDNADDYSMYSHGTKAALDKLDVNNREENLDVVVIRAKAADSEQNHALATVTVELSGQISANLPTVDIKLMLKRTGYLAGKVGLTLGWKENNQDRKFINITASASGKDDDELNDSLKVMLKDAAGTSVHLRVNDRLNNDTILGYIEQDGTRYATITKENGGYFVTYHFNDDGTPASVKSEVFESLF